MDWSPIGGEDLVARPTCVLPASLRDLVSDPVMTQLAQRLHTDSCGWISLRIGLLFQRAGVLFTDAKVRYIPERDAVVLAKGELAQLAMSLTALGEAGLVRLRPLRGGVGDLLSLRRVNSDVCRALGIASEDVGWGSEAKGILSRERHVDSSALGYPDALVFHEDSFPEAITLTLEVATACNFRCGFCYGRHIKQGVLKWDHFIGILDRLPGLRAIEFTGEGEPFLNKHLVDMLAECKRRGLWVHLTTNGSLLDQRTAHRIVELGVNSFAVSIESLSAERFARFRPGGNLDVVLEALRIICQVRRERASTLQIRLWVTLLAETVSELDAIDALARELEIDYVEFQTLNPIPAYTRFYDDHLRSNMLTVGDLRRILEGREFAPAIRRALEDLVRVYDGRRCDIFMSAAMVYWQGDVTPCRLLKVPLHPAVGSILGEAYPQIWQNESFRRFRFALQHGVVPVSCQKCPFVACA